MMHKAAQEELWRKKARGGVMWNVGQPRSHRQLGSRGSRQCTQLLHTAQVCCTVSR